MIQVTIYKLSDGQHITGYEVKGHALFAEAGQDIVCSAVSAIAVGTVNSVEALLNVHMRTIMHDGYLQAFLPEVTSEVANDVQLILQSMVVMLQTIEASYCEYIQIKTDRKRR